MADRDLWIAGQMFEYRKLPLEPKTILFIEDYSGGGGGEVTSFFKKLMEDQDYLDYRFVWTTRDYESSLDQFGALIETERVWIVSRNMPDFLKALSVAGLIVSEGMLPNYFIKREGQRVYSSLGIEFFCISRYTKNQMLNLVKTIEDTDAFLCRDDCLVEECLKNNYGVEQDRIRTISTAGNCVESAENDKKKAVVILGQNKRLLKNGSSFASFLKKTKAILDYYDIDMTAYVSNSFWNKYKSQKEYFGFENVYNEECGGAVDYKDVCLLITDSIPRVLNAQRAQMPVIYWGNESDLFDYDKYLQNYYCASDYPSIYGVFEQVFGGLGADGTILYETDDTQDGCLKEEDQEAGIEMKSVSRKDAKPYSEKRKKILYILRWEKEPVYPEHVSLWLKTEDSEDQDVTLLFLNSGEGELYKVVSAFEKPYRVACRAGFYQSSKWERQMIREHSEDLDDYLENTSHSFIEDEWKRLLGNCRYDTIIAEKTKDYFWNIMYRYSPADQFLQIDKKTKMKMLNSVKNTDQ